VIDSRGVALSPTKEEKAWYMVRHGKATLVSQFPLTIQLNREQDNTDESTFCVGIDPGETSGIALVQKCQTSNKVIFKGIINHRKDVSKRMTDRRNSRRQRRQEKRYRQARFDNRLRDVGWIPPSIKARQDEILRVIRKLRGHVNIHIVTIEEAAFDIRALTDGYKPYSWQYQESNRLDENLRRATLMRDNYTCQLCGCKGSKLQAHHIDPKRLLGEDTIKNLITLCEGCHIEVTGREGDYEKQFYAITGGKKVGLKYASHVMQGKTYLRNKLSELGFGVCVTDGATTANLRTDWGIEKSHSNDAVVIAGLKACFVDVYEWVIKPLRKKRQTTIDKSKAIVQGDRVYYARRGKPKFLCYVTAILQNGVAAGSYKLKDYLGKMYGPVSVNSLVRVSGERGLSFV